MRSLSQLIKIIFYFIKALSSFHSFFIFRALSFKSPWVSFFFFSSGVASCILRNQLSKQQQKPNKIMGRICFGNLLHYGKKV
jgi:uncharacterized membrane protein